MSVPDNYVQQVGGNHYKGGYGHWDYCDDADVPYLEAAATKYISRWYAKNGIEDLEKAISIIEKRLKSNKVRFGRTHHLRGYQFYYDDRQRYYTEAAIKPWERAVSELIFGWRTAEDLEYAKNLILAQIKHEETKQGIKHD